MIPICTRFGNQIDHPFEGVTTMRNFVRSFLCLSIAIATLVSFSIRSASASSGVVAAIEKKYVVTEVSANHDQVTKDGTTMALKCAGIYSLPTNDLMSTPPDNQVVDGKIKSLNIMAKYTLEKFGAHVLQTGDKVYITKIDTRGDAKGDVLKFYILTVDSLDVTGQDAKKKFSASVSFHFKKGYLDDTPPDEVESAVEAIMAPDTGSDEAKGNDNSSGNQAQAQQPSAPRNAAGPAPQNAAAAAPQQAAAPPPPAAAQPAAAPPTISVGESSTQVLQAVGMPQQMIDLGKKKIYIYKNLNMKITFVDDKVSDVQ
jgi:hypothetical protein